MVRRSNRRRWRTSSATPALLRKTIARMVRDQILTLTARAIEGCAAGLDDADDDALRFLARAALARPAVHQERIGDGALLDVADVRAAAVGAHRGEGLQREVDRLANRGGEPLHLRQRERTGRTSRVDAGA